MCQVQGGVGLTRIPDPMHLVLAVRQVQDNYQGAWTWQCAKYKVAWV